jgi:hypothetical protein
MLISHEEIPEASDDDKFAGLAHFFAHCLARDGKNGICDGDI